MLKQREVYAMAKGFTEEAAMLFSRLDDELDIRRLCDSICGSVRLEAIRYIIKTKEHKEYVKTEEEK